MPKITYTNRNFSRASLEITERTNAIVDAYTAQGYSLSLALEQESMERRRLQVELHSLILNMHKTSPVPRYIKERLKREKE